jgi:hypothetical protein
LDFPNTKYGRALCSIVQLLSAAVCVVAFPSQRITYVVEKRIIVCIVEGKKKDFFECLEKQNTVISDHKAQCNFNYKCQSGIHPHPPVPECNNKITQL